MTPLQKAAQAVIDRWDSPAWKDQPHTADYINELRKALKAELARPESTAVSLMRAENVALRRQVEELTPDALNYRDFMAALARGEDRS